LNVVFDLGGVVVTWSPDRIIENVVADDSMRGIVRSALFEHPDWLELDRGVMDLELATRRAALRAGVAVEEIGRVMDEMPRSLIPIPESLDLIQEVKAAGNRVYALSNMHHASIRHLEREYSFLQLFEGAVISCRIGMAKPEPEIFQFLISRYDLEPADTVFIDDVHRNLETASLLGIGTMRFESPTQCRRELERLGCLPAPGPAGLS
jgi:putative hydrolase of the HAD superfamily